MSDLEKAARDALELCERIIEGKRIWSLRDMRLVRAVLREALEQAEPVVDRLEKQGLVMPPGGDAGSPII
jgi:hypothetical protein